MDLHQGVRTGGHDRFHSLTRARVTKVNLWKLKRLNLPEDSVCAENILATTMLSVSKKRKRRKVDGPVWIWIWSCREVGCRIHDLLGKLDLYVISPFSLTTCLFLCFVVCFSPTPFC